MESFRALLGRMVTDRTGAHSPTTERHANAGTKHDERTGQGADDVGGPNYDVVRHLFHHGDARIARGFRRIEKDNDYQRSQAWDQAGSRKRPESGCSR